MWGSIKNQLRSVIEWSSVSPETVFEKWTSSGDEIKNASKLIVGPGQGCLFVYEGKVEGIYAQPGIVELKTANIPFWTTVTKIMQGFESEHKVGIYFFKQSQLTDIKWGTSSTIKYEDPKYKFPVGLRAFGNFSLQIRKADWFFQNIVGARDVFLTEELRDLIVSRILQPLVDSLAQAKFTFTEIDAHRGEIAATLTKITSADFDKLGFELLDFRVEGTSFDEDTLKRVNRIADMSAESQAASAAGVNFTQLQQLEALKNAAKNPGGAGMAMGMGVGMGFGSGLGQQAMGVAQGNSNGEQNADDLGNRLKKLKSLLEQNLISQEEYDAKKKEILAKV